MIVACGKPINKNCKIICSHCGHFKVNKNGLHIEKDATEYNENKVTANNSIIKIISYANIFIIESSKTKQINEISIQGQCIYFFNP